MAKNIVSQNTLAKRVSFLKKVPLFSTVRETYLVALANDFQTKVYRKGDIIFHQADQSREIYLINKGKVRIFQMSSSGEETTMRILFKRQLIGEFAIIDGEPRSATAQAVNTCVLMEMTQDKFLRYLEDIPKLALEMCKQIIRKTRWTSMYAETIAQFDTPSRLMHILLSYNDLFGIEEEPGKRYVLDLGLNQTDLASLAGARRQWINRILQDWRRRGLIEFNAGKIIILNLPAVHNELGKHTDA